MVNTGNSILSFLNAKRSPAPPNLSSSNSQGSSYFDAHPRNPVRSEAELLESHYYFMEEITKVRIELDNVSSDSPVCLTLAKKLQRLYILRDNVVEELRTQHGYTTIHSVRREEDLTRIESIFNTAGNIHGRLKMNANARLRKEHPTPTPPPIRVNSAEILLSTGLPSSPYEPLSRPSTSSSAVSGSNKRGAQSNPNTPRTSPNTLWPRRVTDISRDGSIAK